MATEKRKVLSDGEKADLLKKHKECYICLDSLDGYNENEIEFDHIYNYKDGYPQIITNFAPVHASNNLKKKNCHRSKGRKPPVVYREELRIKRKLNDITGLKDLCPTAINSKLKIDEKAKTVSINGTLLPLYNQKLNGKDNYYFFHEIDTKYIENDDEIQLRPLEPKILPLIFNLKHSVQLLPSLGRYDNNSNTIKIFDGQHKAVAQIIGNNREKIACIIFVNSSVEEMRVVIYQAHTDFVQQRYKKSHIDSKLADIYKQKVESFRKGVGDPNAKFTEENILKGETKASIRKFLMSSIISEINIERSFIREYAAESRSDQKRQPMLWQSLEKLVTTFCKTEVADTYSDDINNYRSDEIENICFLLDQIEEFAIRNKWDPDNSDSKMHQLSRTHFYRTSFNNWIIILEEALRFSFETKRGAKFYEPLCYQKVYDTDLKVRFKEIIKKLFEHPLWVQESIQNEIAKTNVESAVNEIFKREGLDYIYLSKL